MKILKFPKLRFFRPLLLGLALGIVGAGSLTLGAIANHMDIPTFVTSWTVPKVTATELKQGQLHNIILVDVRAPEEYAEDRIAGSVLVPLSDLEAGFGVKQIEKIAGNTPQPTPTIVLYCTAGVRSVKAYKYLEKTGLNLVSLTGGITAWRELVPREQDAGVLAPFAVPQN